MAESAVHMASGSSASALKEAQRQRLRGRAFYESIGSPKLILAPMVDQSEFAWRMLSRSFMSAKERSSFLAYTPMFHARLFAERQDFRDRMFQPVRSGMKDVLAPEQVSASDHDFLDGRPGIDRPLTVQFCANDPQELLAAARHVQPYCDAVDLNLGCPQGIARKGHYGAFLQEDWELVAKLISTLNENLEVPVTAKIRILETKEKTLAYAQKIVDAGASILTVHGRLREQKGHLTGLADWEMIRFLRDSLPKEVVMFANGNILRYEDIQRCIDATGVDGVMSAEGNLSDPTIFAEPPRKGEEGREYWRGRDGKGGYRMDAVFRRYLDIIYQYALDRPPPKRKPLFMPSDPQEPETETVTVDSAQALSGSAKRPADSEGIEQPAVKRRKGNGKKISDPNLVAMQPHLFHLLRPLVAKHHNVRDALGRSRKGDIEAYENVLSLTEEAVKQGLIEYEKAPEMYEDPAVTDATQDPDDPEASLDISNHESSLTAVKVCKRPYWVCQAYVRPVPKEALEKGALHLSKKDLQKMVESDKSGSAGQRPPEGTGTLETPREQADAANGIKRDEIPKEAMIAG